MANSSIERMLEINNKIEGKTASLNDTVASRKIATKKDLDGLIENYDKQVYGPIAEPILKKDDMPKYDARADFNRIKKMEESGGRPTVNLEGRNIPKSIVESILNNPLDMPAVVDPKMDELEQKLANKGIKAARDIMIKTDKQDKEAIQKLNEQLGRTQKENNLDYETLKTVITNVIDEKLNAIKESLNETVSHKQMYVPSMKYMSFKDKFYLVDNDDNVFECEMKYKGKRKKR